MANVEMQLLSRIIRRGCIAEVLEWGVHSDDFRTSEGRGLFLNIFGYWKAFDTRSAVPGPYLIKEFYPSFEFCDDDSMTIPALCAEVRKQRLASETKEFIMAATEDLDTDPVKSISLLAERLIGLQSLGMQTNDQQFSAAVDDLMQRYELAEQGMMLSKMQWPWQPFNDATGGLQDDDYIVIYGRPKSMKSFVVSEMAARFYDQGCHVLAYTKEMPAWQLFRRIGACVARLPYDELRLGKLLPDDRTRFEELYNMVKEQSHATGGRHNVTCISGRDAPSGQDSMSWVRSKIEKYKPDVVIIDGLYLMSSDTKKGKDHERVASISRAGRQMVLETGIPLVATMQANRQAAKNANAELDEIAYSDAIGQDATCAIRVINEKITPTLALVVGGSREFKLHGVRIHGRPCVDFGFKEEMSEKEIEKAAKKDVDIEGEGNKGVIRQPVTSKANGASATSNLTQEKEHQKIVNLIGDIAHK